jgi:hypothetical protein
LLRYYPEPGLYFPPTLLARSHDFESGYVIPSIRGRYEGTLTAGAKTYDFNNVVGYHDHNWGIWQQLVWNWGHLHSDVYNIFFGEIFLAGKSKGLFVGVFDRKGFVSVFRPDKLIFSDFQRRAEGIEVPKQWEMAHEKRFSSLRLQGNAQSVVATPVDSDNSLYFIQYKADYTVTLRVDGTATTFRATGNAETFVAQ